jgi:hypothetical protein
VYRTEIQVLVLERLHNMYLLSSRVHFAAHNALRADF